VSEKVLSSAAAPVPAQADWAEMIDMHGSEVLPRLQRSAMGDSAAQSGEG
jgi:hypothetical protein